MHRLLAFFGFCLAFSVRLCFTGSYYPRYLSLASLHGSTKSWIQANRLSWWAMFIGLTSLPSPSHSFLLNVGNPILAKPEPHPYWDIKFCLHFTLFHFSIMKYMIWNIFGSTFKYLKRPIMYWRWFQKKQSLSFC